MKIRIYKSGEEVVVDTPSLKYQELGIENCPHPGRFRDGGEPFDMEVMELEDLEALTEGKNEAGSGQFYYQGNTLKHDSDWSEILMDPVLIKIKHRKRLVEALDAELAKESPSAVEALKLSRERDKINKKTDLEMYQIALDNLPPEKIKIKKKLEDKLK